LPKTKRKNYQNSPPKSSKNDITADHGLAGPVPLIFLACPAGVFGRERDHCEESSDEAISPLAPKIRKFAGITASYPSAKNFATFFIEEYHCLLFAIFTRLKFEMRDWGPARGEGIVVNGLAISGARNERPPAWRC